MKRLRYFTGQLLTTEDFQIEQEYHLEKHRRQNLRAGIGVARGLQVSVSDHGIHVGTGLAIDGHGNEIVVEQPQLLPLPAVSESVWLVLSFVETLTDPVPAAGESSAQPSRVEEGFRFDYTEEADGSDVHSIKLKRLTFHKGRWLQGARGDGLVKVGLILTVAWIAVRWAGRRLA